MENETRSDSMKQVQLRTGGTVTVEGSKIGVSIHAPAIFEALLRRYLDSDERVRVVDIGGANVVVLMGREWRVRLSRVKQESPGTPVALITCANDPGLREREANALDAVIDSNEDLEEVVTALRAAATRRGYYSAGTHAALHSDRSGAARRAAKSWDSLTQKQRDIARDAGRGLPAKEIARRRGVSQATVKSHLTHIYAKLELRGKMDLIRYVMETGNGVEGKTGVKPGTEHGGIAESPRPSEMDDGPAGRPRHGHGSP